MKIRTKLYDCLMGFLCVIYTYPIYFKLKDEGKCDNLRQYYKVIWEKVKYIE